MAYNIGTNINAEYSNHNPHTVAWPDGHQADDIAVVMCSVDVGGGTMTASGWTEIGSQATNEGTISSMWWKKATGSSEADFSCSSQSRQSITSMSVWRHADTTSPIDVVSRTDSANSTSSTLASGTPTTTTNNVAMIYAWCWDGNGRLLPDLNAGLNPLTRPVIYGSTQQVTGFKNINTAGATSAVTGIYNSATEGGTCYAVGVKDSSPSTPQMSPQATGYPTVLKYYGPTTSFAVQDTTTFQDCSNITATSINSISVSTNTPIFGAGSTIPEDDYDVWAGYPAASFAVGWAGFTHTLPTVNMDGKLISLQWKIDAVQTPYGAQGVIIYFEDGSGNWAAFQLSTYKYSAVTPYTSYVDVAGATPYDSSGTIDWTAVTRFALMYHRDTVTSGNRSLYFKLLLMHNKTTLTGGNVNSVALPFYTKTYQNTWIGLGYNSTQGTGQTLLRSSLQLGDGTTPTYVGLRGTSTEFPQSYLPRIPRRLWQVADSATEIRIYASANDVMRIRACVLATDSRQDFIIDSSSSTSAEYNFEGAVVVGYDVTGQADIAFNDCTFRRCYQIVLNGGGLDGAIVTDSLDSTAVITDDPEAIVDTAFTSAGTGHAIEFTATGTFDFGGNTFTDYGSDGTTDAAIYNNSGGLITLDLQNDSDPTPTVLNGAGASTVINSPTDNQSVTVSGATAGSRIQIYDLTSSTELYNGTPTFPHTWQDASPYVADREIRLRVAYVSGATAKLFIDTTIGTSTASVPAVAYQVNQEDDAVYNTNAIDGSTVTTVTIDDNNLLIEVDTGSISWKTIYAYETYWLFTNAGIIDEGRAILAVDAANYIVQGFQIKNVTSGPTVPLVITGGYAVDSITGSSIDIVDTSGGTIFNAPDHVVAYATGSGVTAGDVTDIADAVWDETISGHVTSGTTGRVLKDGADSAELGSIT